MCLLFITTGKKSLRRMPKKITLLSPWVGCFQNSDIAIGVDLINQHSAYSSESTSKKNGGTGTFLGRSVLHKNISGREKKNLWDQQNQTMLKDVSRRSDNFDLTCPLCSLKQHLHVPIFFWLQIEIFPWNKRWQLSVEKQGQSDKNSKWRTKTSNWN